MKTIYSYLKLNIDLIIINLFFLIISILFYLLSNQKFEVIGAILATGISLSFGIRQYKIENDKMFKELFQEFNKKYDKKFNDKLNEIDCQFRLNNQYTISNREDRGLIIDYLNLCSEEYLWYSKGRIPEKVWKAWKAGMLYFLSLPPIKKIIKEQFNQKDSYYGLFEELKL